MTHFSQADMMQTSNTDAQFGVPLAQHPAEIGAESGAADGAIAAVRGGGAPSAPCPPVSPGRHGADGAGARQGGGTARAGTGARHGAATGAGHGAADGAAYDAALVIARLEEAGTAILALPASGYSTKLRSSNLIPIPELSTWADVPDRLRPPPPSSATITRMDEAFDWIRLLPADRHVIRRIVGARCLVHPATQRHLFSWRRLGGLLGADPKAVKSWHAQGIDRIVDRLNRGG